MEEQNRQQNHGGHPIRPSATREGQRQVEPTGAQTARREDHDRDEHGGQAPGSKAALNEMIN